MVRTIERRIQNQYQQISTTSIVIFIRYCPQFSTGTILIDSLPSGSMKLASQILEILIFSAFMKTTEQTRDNSPLLEMWSILWHDGIYTFCICFCGHLPLSTLHEWYNRATSAYAIFIQLAHPVYRSITTLLSESFLFIVSKIENKSLTLQASFWPIFSRKQKLST